MQLDQFYAYSEQLEAYLKKEIISIEKSFNDQVEALKLVQHVEKSQLFEMHYEDQCHSLNNEFPTILRTSLFLSVYTFLEKTLNDLCKDYEKDCDIKLNDIKHKGITKSKFYLINVCNIDFPTIDWELIQQYNIIRNFLAHEGYSLSINNPKFQQLSKRENRLKNAINKIVGTTLIDKGGFDQVYFDESFCDNFLDVVYKFIFDLSESIKDNK